MNKKGLFGIIFFIVIIIGALVAVYHLAYAFTTGTETITIDEKWVKYNNDDAKYLVSSEDGQVFQITDTLVKLRFDSSNLYAEIEEGSTYDVATQGWRFALLSDYKNILEIR